MASSILVLLGTIAGTVVTFATINFAIFKINPTYFDILSDSGFFKFFYYSFNTFLFNSVKEVVPIHAVSQSVSMFESALALVLIAILINLFISVKAQRTADEIGKIITLFEDEGAKMETFIKDEYRIATVEDAVAELETLQTGMIKLIGFLTRRL
jgi:hypothetical protein